MRKNAIIGFLLFGALMLAACDFGLPRGGPTPTILQSVEPTEVAVEPSVTMTASQTPLPQLESPSPTYTPGQPTFTYTPSATPGPVEYTIQPGDTLLYIIQQSPFNYTNTNVIAEILRLNPLLTSIDQLPPPGSTILIPLPTPSNTPEGYDLTQTANPATATPELSNAPTTQHTIGEGETILGVAGQYNTTLVILATLNPDIGFFGCDYSNPSGGPDCTVPLQVGQQVNVPMPTHTPTMSPTFSGSETPTVTPTFPPPPMVFPPQDGVATARTFLLQWVSVGILQGNQAYIVQIEDTTSGATHLDTTRATSYELPESMIPTDGQTHTIRWRISVGEPTEQGTWRIVSGDGEWRTFQWQSR
jgi:LysM repeat protein